MIHLEFLIVDTSVYEYIHMYDKLIKDLRRKMIKVNISNNHNLIDGGTHISGTAISSISNNEITGSRLQKKLNVLTR